MKKNKISSLAVLIIVYSIVIILLTKNYVPSGNIGSRFAAIQSIVEEGTFIIDNSTFQGNAIWYEITDGKYYLQRNGNEWYNGTNDKIFVNGHYYSDKLPLYSVLSSGIYWILYQFGISFNSHPAICVYIITILATGLFSILLLFYFYKLSYAIFGRRIAMLLSISLGFCSLIFSYSITYNVYTVLAFLLVLGYYNLLDLTKQKNSIKNLLVIGIIAGLGVTLDIVVGGIFLIIFMLLIFKRIGLNYRYSIFLLGLCLPIIAHALLNVPITGDLLQGSAHAEFWDYPGSEFDANTLSGTHSHSSMSSLLLYGFNVLIGSRGLLLYTPLFILSLIGIYISLKKREYLFETITIYSGISIVIIYYIVMTTNFGGYSYGMRWFVPFTPFLILYLGYYLQAQFHKRYKFIFYTLMIISFIFSVVGLYQPWTNMWRTSIPFINNLVEISQFYVKPRFPMIWEFLRGRL